MNPQEHSHNLQTSFIIQYNLYLFNALSIKNGQRVIQNAKDFCKVSGEIQ